MSQKLDAVQIYALAQRIAADPNLSRNYYIGNDLRSYEYNAQRGLTEIASRKFQQKFGKTPEQVFDEINRRPSLPTTSAQAQNANAYDKEISNSVKLIDLSKNNQPAPAVQHPNTALLVPCHTCGIDVAITLGKYQAGGEVAYCPKCLQKANVENDSTVNAIRQFVQEVPSFYPHPANLQFLGDECERRGFKSVNLDQLTEVYATIKSKMPFKRLSPEEGRAMTSEQWAERAKVDPGVGGLDLEGMRQGQPRGEATIHSSNKTKTFYLPQTGVKS